MELLGLFALSFVGGLFWAVNAETAAVLYGSAHRWPAPVIGLACAGGQSAMYVALFFGGDWLVRHWAWLGRKIAAAKARWSGHLGRSYLVCCATGGLVGVPPATAMPILASGFDVPLRHLLPVLFLTRLVRFTILAAAGGGLFGGLFGPGAVRPGLDVLVEEGFAPLRGKRVALVTNHTGVDRKGRSAIDLLHEAAGVSLVAILAPEHGVRGTADAPVASGRDEGSGLPILSLYGATKRPTPEMLRGVDAIVFDIQDAGARFYTYPTTLAYCLEAAAAEGKEVFVLDRPNPLGGAAIEGPILEPGLRGGFASFHALPARHGLTIGEIGRWYVAEKGLRVALTVIPARGWRRGMLLDATGLPWVPPSPNLRSLTAALHYPGLGALEASNLSVGRGTETPFELYGAPWVDGPKLEAALALRHPPGVRFRAAAFTPRPIEGRPRYPYTDELCGGVAPEIVDRAAYRPVLAALHVAQALLALHPDRFEPRGFAGMLGRRDIDARLRAGEAPEAIAASWEPEIEAYRAARRGVLIYPE